MAAEELAVFQPSTARKLLAMLQAWERTPGFNDESESHAYREHFPFLNSSGHTIPPYGIFLVDGTSEENGINYLIAKRYATYTAAQSVPMVNGPFEVLDGEYGSPQLGPVFRVVHDDAITYSVGDRVGWKDSSFQVALNAAFIVLGDDDIVENCIRVKRDFSSMMGQSILAISDGASGVIRRRVLGSGGWTTDTTKSYPARNDTGTSIDASSRLLVLSVDGIFSIVQVC
jgi:hypothetical protein